MGHGLPSEANGRYQPVFLGNYGEDGYVITAVALLVVGTTHVWSFPHEIIASSSKILLYTGDATTVIVE
ncbi:MAG: hypothetical protein JXA30_07290 [Deltaproteobacteria bacterium]|nr:hypothetical protein [Deltaproteobacteria bacterium]